MAIKLNFPRTYHRVYPVPLDDSSVYTALTDAEYYALSGKTSYIGQIITFVDEEASSVTVYKIATDKTLQPIGETGLSEDAVIEILHQNGYITSGDTLGLISNEISNVEKKIPTKVSDLENDAGYLTKHQDLSDYATKNELSSVSSITNNLYTAVTSDIKNINASISGLTNTDKQLQEKVDELSGSTITIDKKLEDLSGNTDNAIQEVRQYIDTQISGIPKQTIYKADGKTISGQINKDENFVTFSVIESAITISSKQVSGLSNELSSLETTLKDEINSKVSSVYRVKGSCKYEELPKDGQEVGDVWNVTDAHDNTPAGTNFVWTDEGWDPLGGTIDLSPYVKETDISTAITSIKEDIQTVKNQLNDTNSNIQELTSGITDFKKNVEDSNKAFTENIAALDERISGNTDDITELSGITEGLSSSIKDLSDSAKTFDESIKTINSNLVSINERIVSIKDSISELSEKDEQLQSQINNLTESLNTANSALTDAVSEIENVKEIVKSMMDIDASLLQDIQSLSGTSTDHEERIEKLERETNTNLICEKIFADNESDGFDEFKIEKSGNTVSIALNGFDGGIIELD